MIRVQTNFWSMYTGMRAGATKLQSMLPTLAFALLLAACELPEGGGPLTEADMCGLDQRAFFEKAVERLRDKDGVRVYIERQGERFTYDTLLPHSTLAKKFLSYPNAAAFLADNTDCCEMFKPRTAAWQVLRRWYISNNDRRSPPDPIDTVEVVVKYDAWVEGDGKKGLWQRTHHVLMGRCAVRFDYEYHDLQSSIYNKYTSESENK
jgi:hypothetical protein